MSPQLKPRHLVPLAQLAPGTPFRLFTKYRDKSARPRFKFDRYFLAQHELRVEEHREGYTLVRCGKSVIPLCSQMRIAL